MRRRIVPFWLPQLGCGIRCIYCNQTALQGEATAFPEPGEIERQLRQAARTTAPHSAALRTGASPRVPLEAAFYGGTFTALPPDTMRRYLGAVAPLVEEGLIDSVRVSTHPCHVNPGLLATLASLHVRTVELGIQSFDDEVLACAGRGYGRETAIRACAAVRDSGLELAIQLMPFLPGADEERDVASARTAAALEPSGLRIFPTLVLRGTGLEELWREGRYAPATVEQACQRVALMLEPFIQAPAEILRIGLQESRSLAEAFLAGPRHPALGELCWAHLLARIAARHGRETAAADPGRGAGACGSGYTIRLLPRGASLMLGHDRYGERTLARLWPEGRWGVERAVLDCGLAPSQSVWPRLTLGNHTVTPHNSGLWVD